MTKLRAKGYRPVPPAPTAPVRILIVEDERIVAEDLQSRLQHLGYSVIGIVSDGKTAVETAGRIRPDLVLMDIRLDGPMDGIEAAELVRTRHNLPVIYLTAHADDRTIAMAKQTQPFGYLLKPFDDRELLTSIEMAFFKHGAERELRESEARFRAIAETAPAAIFITSKEKVIFINSFGVALTGYPMDELLQMNISKLLRPDFRERMKEQTCSRRRGAQVPWRHELAFVRKDGSDCWVDVASGPIEIGGETAVLGTAFDITDNKRMEEEQKSLQEQLFQAQKMESLGTLVVGLAHNLNNILAIILGYASRLERGIADPSRLAQSVAAIEKAVHRGAGLIQQLVGVTRKANLIIAPVNMNAVIEELTRMLAEIFPKGIVFRHRLDPALPPVGADQNQLHQALMNICVNARDAMPDGGTLSIDTETVPGSSLQAKFPQPLNCPYVRITVADTGTGFDEEIKSHLFEPFFTTKDRALHNGLGLAVTYGITLSHKGFIEVESQSGKGTSFFLYFPAYSDSTDEQDARPEAKKSVPGGHETLLSFEEEGLLRKALDDKRHKATE